jgi:hypothetical protein
MLLVHDERLLGLVDAWLTGVPPEAFNDVLPLLRRTFSEFESGVRRTVGELVRRGDAPAPAVGAGAAPSGFAAVPDAARADAVLPVLRLLLGLDTGADPGRDPGGATGGDIGDDLDDDPGPPHLRGRSQQAHRPEQSETHVPEGERR